MLGLRVRLHPASHAVKTGLSVLGATLERASLRQFGVPASAGRPPSAELFEVDAPAAVLVDRFERSAHLRIGKSYAERVEQLAQLDRVNLTVAVVIDTLEAVAQGIATHAGTIRRFVVASNCALVLTALACRGAPQPEPQARASAAEAETARDTQDEPKPSEHPPAVASAAALPTSLAPLPGPWLVRLETAEVTAFVAPPIGATAPRPLVVGVHGAGDRPEWSCGGWRLASLSNAFVVCPQGQQLSAQTFAWVSPKLLAERVDQAVAAAQAKFAGYIEPRAMIFAAFSQGATFAEPFLRENAARFPIAILAEGGYATARSPSFARAYRAGGGRRVVLVCGGASCFASAASAKKVLEAGGVEALVVGDPKAGHNLNERMQKALQAAWPEISAPPSDLGGDH